MSVWVMWHRGDNYWDTALPKYILERAVPNAVNAIFPEGVPEIEGPLPGKVVIVIPGRHSCGDYEALTKFAAAFPHVVWFIIGDEENIFHSDRLQHPNQKIWWAMPPFNPKQKVDRLLPNGWPSAAPELISRLNVVSGTRDLEWSFLGQMTHSRRIACVNATQHLIGEHPEWSFRLETTNGFAQGVEREDYYAIMLRSKVVLCPSGPCTPDSFRFAEALEAGCIPIVDDLTQDPTYPGGYWRYLFGWDVPFPIIRNWSLLPNIMEHQIRHFAEKQRACQEWWALRKQEWISWMKEDLAL